MGDPGDPSVVFHQPPEARLLRRLLGGLVDFANRDVGKPFVHSVVRAVAAHFMMAYIHPFVDGDGGTARALF